MQGVCKRLMATLLLAVLCIGLTGAGAAVHQETSATEVIRLYPQHRYWSTDLECTYLCRIPLKVTDKQSNMCSSGCMIWAFVHAVEWCRQEKIYTAEMGNLIKEFLAENNAPWDVQYVVDDCYYGVCRAHGVEVLSEVPATQEELFAFFARHGAVICNMGGHCAVAVGYTYYDYDGDGTDDLMLHMVDSALWSSASKQTIYHFKTMQAVPSTKETSGEFWLPYTVYETMDRLALIPAEALEE